MSEAPLVIECEAEQTTAQTMRCNRCRQSWPLQARYIPPCKNLPYPPKRTIVVLVSQERIEAITRAPAFGMAFWRERVILIRDNLPARVRRAIIAHECNHIERGDRGGFFSNEVPAWWAQLTAEPLGTLQAILLSLSPRRLAWYARRIFVDNH